MAANVKVVRRKEANGEWESSDSLIRRFKKSVQKADILKEIRKREHITVKDYLGKWYVIDEMETGGEMLYLLEHETYGDEVPCVIVNADGNLVLDDVWNGFEDYLEWKSSKEN